MHTNQEGVARGINPISSGSQLHTQIMKTEALKQALDHWGFDAAFGGARRDEEKSRAKERVFSFRSAGHIWDPRNQRPELWNLLQHPYRAKGESIRVFPLSNWTELDVWEYTRAEDIPVVPLYFAAPRPVVERDGLLIMRDDERLPLLPRRGASRCAWFASARWAAIRCPQPSRATRPRSMPSSMKCSRHALPSAQAALIDNDEAASMEKKKREGYF